MRADDARARRMIVAAAAAGLVLRLAFALLYWVDRPLTHDEREYLALAHSLRTGSGFVYAEALEVGTGQRFGRAPGYPVFLAVLDAGRLDAAGTPAIVKVAQSLIGALTVWLIGVIARRAAGGRTGAAAAWIAALYPPLVWIPAYALSETLYCLLALGTAFVLQEAATRARSAASGALGLAIAAGLIAGAAALVRPAMLLFLPLAFLWLLLTRRAGLAFAVCLAAAIVILPWTLRNLIVHERFVLIASEGGVTFWTGNHPLAIGEGDLAANLPLKRAELELRQRHPGLSSEDLEPIYYREALDWIAAHPGQWAWLVARKGFYTVVPLGPSYAVHSARYRLASIVPYLLVLPMAVLGARRLWRGPERSTALFLLASSAILMCLVFFPQERFRIPIIDPTLIIAAAAAFGRQAS